MMDYDKLSDAEIDKMVSAKMGASAAPDYHSMSDADLDHAVRQKMSATPAPHGREGEAFLQGAGNALTLGYLPHLQAGASKLGDMASDAIDKYINRVEPTGKESYLQLRDKFLKRQDELAQENPISYGGGAVAGTIGGSLLLPSGLIAKGGQLATKGAQALGLGKLAPYVGAGLSGGATGAAIAGAANPGDKQGEMGFQPEARAKNALMGGAFGAAVPMAAMGIKDAGAKISGGLKDMAEKRAFDALGGGKSAVSEATAKGQLNDIGRQLLDEDIVKFGSGKQAIADRLDQSIADKSSALKQALSEVQAGKGLSPEQMAQVNQTRFNPKQAGDILKDNIRSQFSALPEEAVQSRIGQVDKFLSKDQPMNIDQAQSMKQQISKFIKDPTYWKDSTNPGQETLAGIRRMIKEGIEKNADSYASALGEQGGKVKAINSSLGKMLESQGVVDDRLARDLANRSFSITDYLAGSAGGQALGGPGAVASALANKVARERGSAAMAVGADKTANLVQALTQSPRFQTMAQKSPAAFANMTAAIGRKAGLSTEDVPAGEVKDRYLSGN